jgi:hypothetical protein
MHSVFVVTFIFGEDGWCGVGNTSKFHWKKLYLLVLPIFSVDRDLLFINYFRVTRSSLGVEITRLPCGC